MEFANWAFMSDADHDAAADAQRAVSATLAATQRMQTMCNYSLSNTAPTASAAPLTLGAAPMHPSPAAPQRTHSAPLDSQAQPTPAPYMAHSRRASESVTAAQSSCEPQVAAAGGVGTRPAGKDFVDENTGTLRGSGAWSAGARSSADSAAHLSTDPAALPTGAPGRPSGGDAMVTPQLITAAGAPRSSAEVGGAVSTGVPDPEMVMATGGGVRFTCGRGDKHARYAEAAVSPQQQERSSTVLPLLPESCSPGDRDSVVEQWLKRNAEMLARLQ